MLGLSLSACGTGGTALGQAAAAQGPVVVVQKASAYDSKILGCRDGLLATDLPIGSHQELDGTSLQLTEQKTTSPHDDPEDQESVTLSIKLSSAVRLPAAIVNSTKGGGRSGLAEPLDDESLDLNIAPGGTGNFVLPTIAYTEVPILGDQITSVTLCLDLSQTATSDG